MTAIAAQERPVMDPRGYLGAAWRHPVLRAVSKAFLTIVVATFITFLLIRLLPGNPIDLRIEELTRDGAMTFEQAREQVSALYPVDLDAPLPIQFASYLTSVLRLDLDFEALLVQIEDTDEAKLKDAVKKFAIAFNEVLPAIPLAERFNNAPINDQKRVSGWPALDDKIYANGGGDNFTLILIMDGTLGGK